MHQIHHIWMDDAFVTGILPAYLDYKVTSLKYIFPANCSVVHRVDDWRDR